MDIATLLHIESLNFSYADDPSFSLKINDLSVRKNERLFIEGHSGCGKTTFLNLITGLLAPTAGKISIFGTDITQLNKVESDRFRADHFGIIFQSFNLISYLSVIENIILPCTFSSVRRQNALKYAPNLEKEAGRLCRDLDIDDHLIAKPVDQLSIGQQQRVAIARALIGRPEIIVADEPTSALDDLRTTKFMASLLEKCEDYGTTLIFVSHNRSLHSYFDTVCNLNTLSTPTKETPLVFA